MTPEAEDLLAKAQGMLSDARTILDVGVARVAAREAYMAAFHAAQALIFERQGDVPRTHSGVHGVFGRLAKDEPHLGPRYGKFLPDAYDFKAISDYDTERTVEPAQAEAVIREAAEIIAAVKAALGP